MKRSQEPYFEILGALIGDVIFCATFLGQKWANAVRLLSQLWGLRALDHQIFLLLCHFASICKLVHFSWLHATLVSEGLALFDEEVHRYITNDCVAIDASDSSWLQVQLSFSRPP